MKVEIFTVCDAATVSGGKLNILGSFDRVSAPSFPLNLSECSVAAKMRFENSEHGERQIQIRFVGADRSEPLMANKFSIRVPPAVGKRHLHMHHAQFYNLRFDAPGEYAVELLVDGEKCSQIPLFVVAVPWTAPLYRFLSRRHAEALVKDGNLRLNPPDFLHDEVKLGSAVGDSGEGRQTITVTNTPVTSDLQLPEAVRNLAPHPHELPHPIKCVVVDVVLDSKCEHVLIYSLTKRMASENVAGVPGDTWVVIDNPMEFCKAISQVLPADLQFRGLHPCRYVSSELDYKEPDAKILPVFLKTQRYSHQQEVRAVWISTSRVRRTEPITITCKKIARFCRIVE